jgi:hypothetical protein
LRHVKHAEPQALDPASGFKVPHRNLVRQWDGEYVDKRFVDKRNPQDLLRAKAEQADLPHPRPEPADTFLAINILLEDGVTPMIGGGGVALMTEGQMNGKGL